MSPLLANTLWFLSCLPEARRFQRATRHVERSQTNYLLALLKENEDTAFGQCYRFGEIRTVREFQERVPLTTYEDYEEAITRVGQGETKLLSAEDVTLFEPTSGSTGATKLIPYTAALQREFQRGIAPWIADLFRHHPALMKGRAYWSVSPVTSSNNRTSGGIPIGFEDDEAYLGAQSGLVRSVMAVPSAVKFISDMESFRYVTLLFLLRAADLTLISVWNPTFLTLLIEPLGVWWETLATDIERGTLTPPYSLDPHIHDILQADIRPSPQRADRIRRIFESHTDPASRHSGLWQKLRLISGWRDGNAAPYASHLQTLFPHATIQGKGLLATEGFVSFPLVGQVGAALSLRSHFFEFLPEGDATQLPRLAHELETGKVYEVIITTGGGLYRYRMNDLVKVIGFYHQCPLIKFMGKSALISDWFGEKLNETHVREVITEVLQANHIAFTFAMLAYDETKGRYGLYVEVEEKGERRREKGENGDPPPSPHLGGGIGQRGLWQRVAEGVENGLLENFHYRYCRQLGQLEAVKIFQIEQDALAVYQTRCISLGQRAGNIKPTFLHRTSGWTAVFHGDWIT